MNETGETDEDADEDAHPPRGKKADDRGANAIGKRRTVQIELPEFEPGEVLARHRVTDLIVRHAVNARDNHRQHNKQSISGKFFRDVHGARITMRPRAADQIGKKGRLMKRRSTIFLRIAIVFIGVGILALLLGEPHLEGRNQHATLFEIYFKDYFLAYVYMGSLPFFVALYQAFKLLGYAGQNNLFSQPAVTALRTIKYCAIAILGFVAASVIFFLFSDPDDRPAGVFMRIVIALPSIVVATAAAIFERILRHGVEMKSENDLTVQ